MCRVLHRTFMSTALRSSAAAAYSNTNVTMIWTMSQARMMTSYSSTAMRTMGRAAFVSVIYNSGSVMNQFRRNATTTAAASSTNSTATSSPETDSKTTTEFSADEHQNKREGRTDENNTHSEEAKVEKPLSAFQKLKALFKSMSLKEIIKQYGIPIAIFYWITNEIAVLAVTYLLHYNYVSQNSVVDIIDALGCGAWIDTKILHTHSIQIGSFSISALLLTNFLVASAFLALFVPVKLPLAIWAYPKLRGLFIRNNKAKKVAATAAATTPTAIVGTEAATASAAAATVGAAPAEAVTSSATASP